jgi:hypothetical protein
MAVKGWARAARPLVFGFVLAGVAGVSLARAEDPLEVLGRLYTLPDPNFEAFHDPEIRPGFYTPRIDGLIRHQVDCVQKQYGMEDLDYDFIVPGQDYEIVGLRITLLSREGNRAKAEVAFTNFDEAISLTYDLESLGGHWLIDDVTYQGDRLSKLLETPC